MNPVHHMRVRVPVIARFRCADAVSLCTPVKMHYDHRDITFSRLALRHETHQGQRMIHVFDMSDGVTDYRLEFDAEALTWTLTQVTEAVS